MTFVCHPSFGIERLIKALKKKSPFVHILSIVFGVFSQQLAEGEGKAECSSVLS